MTIIEAQNLTAAPLELFDLGLTIPASASRSLTGPKRSAEVVYASHSVRRALLANELRVRIDSHVLKKAEALTFFSEELIDNGDRRRHGLRRLTLRAPDGSLWDTGVDNTGNLRTRKRL